MHPLTSQECTGHQMVNKRRGQTWKIFEIFAQTFSRNAANLALYYSLINPLLHYCQDHVDGLGN